MRYLRFDLSDGGEGVTTLEALASTSAERHPEVMAEVRQVLDWARSAFPHGRGALDDGMDWDHDLQASAEPGGWHTVTLTLTGSDAFVEAFVAAFPESRD
jgi:hypothetical protein